MSSNTLKAYLNFERDKITPDYDARLKLEGSIVGLF